MKTEDASNLHKEQMDSFGKEEPFTPAYVALIETNSKF